LGCKEGRQTIYKVKSGSIKQTGKTEDIGKWEIPLITILDGKYYVKLTIGQEFCFTLALLTLSQWHALMVMW
jgi:hypothetical protein